MSVFVIAEHRSGELRAVTFELLALARSLNAGAVTAVVAAAPGAGGAFAQALVQSADAVVLLEDPALESGSGGALVPALAALVADRTPSVVLLAHSAAGIEAGPALAAALGAPIATDCIGFANTDGVYTARRAVYGGKLESLVRLASAPTVVATIRPGAFEAAEGQTNGSVETVAAKVPPALGKRFVEWVREAAGDVDITQADVLVSVGRGIGDKENLDVAQALADALGATLSCSRPVVDLHWLPKERQVGISGKTVKPKVYIALGISGAFQHITAMKDSATIIAINKDAKAPIFTVAHYGIVGDLFKIVPSLTLAVKAAK